MGQARIRRIHQEQNPEPVVALALIGWRSMEIPFAYCRDQLRAHPAVKVEIPGIGDALVSRARAMVATKFMEQTDCDVLLSIDTDITFRTEDAVTICRQAMSHDIVAGLYVSRGKGERCKPTSCFQPGQEIEFGTDPTPVPILYASGGFVAVHRRVFERLAQDLPLCHESDAGLRHYPFYDPYPVKNHLGEMLELSEDYALSDRAMRAGFTTYLNPAVRLEHWGVEPHRLEDMIIEEPPTLPLKIRRNEDGTYRREWPEWKPKAEKLETPELVIARG